MSGNMKGLTVLVLAAALAGCGGGGGSSGDTSGGTGGGVITDPGTSTPDTPASTLVADFALLLDKTSITNSGGDSARLTVVAVDANRNVVPGAVVSVSTDQGSVYVPEGSSTDDSGRVSGLVQIGSEKADRDVTVTVTVNGITKRTTVHVGGGKLALSAAPSSPQPGAQVTLTANLTDAAGQPISGQEITLTSATAGIASQTATTATTGDATFTITAPTTPGVYRFNAAGSGTTAQELQLTVLSAGTTVGNASIPPGAVPSLSANRTVLPVNTPGSTANRAVLRFQFLDNGNNPVRDVRVRFDDLTTGLPAQGATILTGAPTLFTDTSGVATAQYVSGQNSSSTNGVSIRACYSAVDFTSATDCPNQVGIFLTVAGQALAVSIGDDNRLVADTTAGTYTKRFAVTVADSAGRPVANAPVDISVDLTHYAKGTFGAAFENGGALVTAARLGRTEASPSMVTIPRRPNPLSTPVDEGLNVWCPNEDVNRNGIVDATTEFAAFGADPARGENYNGSADTNGQPILEPRKADLLIGYDNPNVNTTDANGVLVIKVTYSQRFGGWLAYRIRTTASVAGSQGLAERLFVTDVLDVDKGNGSFLTPPYGTGSCLDPN